MEIDEIDEYLAELEGPLLDEDGMPDDEYLRLDSEEQDVTVLDYHDFRSFSKGKLKARLESIKATGEDN